jgi:hypothetical protein
VTPPDDFFVAGVDGHNPSGAAGWCRAPETTLPSSAGFEKCSEAVLPVFVALDSRLQRPQHFHQMSKETIP